MARTDEELLYLYYHRDELNGHENLNTTSWIDETIRCMAEGEISAKAKEKGERDGIGGSRRSMLWMRSKDSRGWDSEGCEDVEPVGFDPRESTVTIFRNSKVSSDQ